MTKEDLNAYSPLKTRTSRRGFLGWVKDVTKVGIVVGTGIGVPYAAHQAIQTLQSTGETSQVALPPTPVTTPRELYEPPLPAESVYNQAVAAPLVAETQSTAAIYTELVQAHGAEAFRTAEFDESIYYPTDAVNAMPPDMKRYFVNTVQDVSDFFNVRPGDIIGIMSAEQRGKIGIYQPEKSSVGATGVGQMTPRTWNGTWNEKWNGTPYATDFQSNMRWIMENGHNALAFDWEARREWLQYLEEKYQGIPPNPALLMASNADPNLFANAIAGIAIHYVQYGLTRDTMTNPGWFQNQLGEAVRIYNGGPLATRNTPQWAGADYTVGNYMDHVANITKHFHLDLRAQFNVTQYI